MYKVVMQAVLFSAGALFFIFNKSDGYVTRRSRGISPHSFPMVSRRSTAISI